MLTRILRYWSLFIAFFAAYTAWIFITTPSAMNIQNCLVTKQYEVSLCEKNKSYVRLSQISKNLRNMILIAEDSNFYFHSGFEWGELKNSVETNWSLLKFKRGGSTITQQLAKNVFLPFDKSLSRKIREALLTRELESILSKDQIFEKYLNVIELGPKLYGVSDASWRYFNKPAADLNLLEAAFITYLIPNPKVHSITFRNKKLTTYARSRVLDLVYRMYRFKRISQDQYQAAKDYVDEFPWTVLNSYQIARLSGQPLEKLETDHVFELDSTSEPMPEEPDPDSADADEIKVEDLVE